MSIQPYAVNSVSPIAIYPAGLQNSVTVNNNGLNTVYLGDTADRSRGWPLLAGNAMQWHSHTPLYASVNTGAPTTLLVLDSGDVLPFAQVGVSGTLVAQSDIVLLGTLIAQGTSAVFDARPFNTLLITANITNPTSMVETCYLYWYADAAGTTNLFTEEVAFRGNADNARSRFITPVKGPYYAFAIVGAPTNAVARSFGTYGILPPEYFCWSGPTGDRAWDKTAALANTGVGIGATLQWFPGIFAGDAMLSISIIGATNTGNGFSVQMIRESDGVILFNSVISSALGVSATNFPVILGNTPVYFAFINQALIGVTLIAGLVMKGN